MFTSARRLQLLLLGLFLSLLPSCNPGPTLLLTLTINNPAQAPSVVAATKQTPPTALVVTVHEGSPTGPSGATTFYRSSGNHWQSQATMPTMEQVELIGVQLAVDLPPDTSGMVLVQVDAMGLAMGGGPGMDMGASMDMSTGMPGPTIAVTFCATLSVSSKMVYQVPVVPSLNATPGRCP